MRIVELAQDAWYAVLDHLRVVVAGASVVVLAFVAVLLVSGGSTSSSSAHPQGRAAPAVAVEPHSPCAVTIRALEAFIRAHPAPGRALNAAAEHMAATERIAMHSTCTRPVVADVTARVVTPWLQARAHV